MSTSLYKKGLQFISLSIGFAMSMNVNAQNLVLNPSFETVNLNNLQCSWYTTKAQFANAVSNWNLPTEGSSDIFHTSLATTCFSSPFSTHADAVGQQAPRTGDAMAAILVYGTGGCTPYREYIQGSLSTPLQVGQSYEVEFYVSLADNSTHGANNIGVKFSGSQYNANDMCVYNVTPDLNSTNIVTDKQGWTKISFCYTPTVANLRYFIIGNFYGDAATATQNTGSGGAYNIRYFIDDVRIEKVVTIPTTTTNDTVRVCQSSNINLYDHISATLPTTGAWTGPSALSGGYLGTFNSASNTYGTYTYTVSNGDCSGNIIKKVVVLGQSASLMGAIASSNAILCNGGRTNLNLSVTGGTAPYSYLWNAGQTTQNLSNVGAGTYSVQITDANNCTTQDNITITEPAVLANALTQTQPVLCFGDASAALSNNTSGGTIPYSYTWNFGQTTSNVSNLVAGFYKVEIKDANNCVRYDSIQITEPTSLTSSLASTGAILCNGNSTGIAAAVNGGTTPYSFSWNTGATTQNLNNVSVGSYSFTVTDANNCTSNSNLNITEPTAMISTLSQLQAIDCHGDLTGINLSVTGGTAPYSYLWNAGQTTQNLSNVGAGTYSVQITDANNCTIQDNITITEPAVLANTLTQTQPILCFGDVSAALSNNTSGGTVPYFYTWNTGQTTSNVSNLAVGFYKVEIKDANNCVRYDSIQITEPASLISSLASTGAILCNGNLTGIAATVNGGTTPYSFSWNTGATTQNLNNVSVGSYSFTVTDANNCTSNSNLNITEPTAMISTLSQLQAIDCHGDLTGINLSVTGGTAPYSYLWNAGQTTQNLSNVGAGTYSVQITDANNCTIQDNITITEPAVLANTLTQTQPILCFGDVSAALSNNTSGGTVPYFYTWNTGQTTSNVSNLAVGFYKVEIKDANNCVRYDSIQITEPASLISSLASTGAILCNGNLTGIAATVNGGTTPYSFSWNTGATTQNLNNVSVGSYSFTVTDANNCTSNSNLNITEPTAMISTLSQLQAIDCHGDLTGINLSVTGGTAPYSYLWNAGQTTQNLSNVGAGTYSVQITDANNCTIQDNITITEPAVLANTLTQTQPILCFGDVSAALSNNTSGGTVPYSYAWNTGQTTNSVSNLVAGFYKVEIKDANNCTYWDSIQITQPALITAQYQNVFCSTASYTLPSGKVIQSSGVYQDTISAANGCDSIITLDLTLSNIQAQANMVSNVSCFGFNDGTASVVATGGVQPYNYLWSNNQTTASINNLSPGNYAVIIKDDVNCLDTLTVSITSPAELVVTVSPSVEFCEGNTALLISSAVGGVEPYTVSWSNNVNTWSQNVQPNTTTNYTVNVVDNNGCVSTNGTSVTVFPNPIAIITTDLPSPVTAGTTITFHDESKLGDFNIWSLEDGTSYVDKEQIALTFEEEGEYCVSFATNTIHNCVDNTRVCIVVHPEFNLYIPNSFTPNGDKNNEYFRVVGRGYNNMTLSIFNRWGEELIRLEGDQPVMIGWDGSFKGQPSPQGVYTYKLIVTDLKNKNHTYYGFINLIR